MITFYRVKSCVILNWVYPLNSVTKMASRQYKTSLDWFCYVCGYYICGQRYSYKTVKGTKYWTACRLYFGMDTGNQDKSCAPHVICGSCRSNLKGWWRGLGRVLSIAISRVWREPQNHDDDCYFCLINILKYRKVRGRRAMTYPSIPSSIASVPHSDALPVPSPLLNVSNFMWVI